MILFELIAKTYACLSDLRNIAEVKLGIARYLTFLLLFSSPVLQALPAHVHGKAQLQVAIEGNEIHLVLESPLDNFLGFEHSPKNDQQRQLVKSMAAQLRQAGKLFVTPKDCECHVKTVKLSSPVLAPELLGNHHKTEPDAHQLSAQDEDSHAGLEAEILLNCGNSEALNMIDVQLFKSFPSLHELQVEMVTVKGQSVTQLQPDSHVLSW